jgi:glycosyltransferase involved in cell wall biosynthesis
MKNISILHPKFSDSDFDQSIIDISRALVFSGNNVQLWTNKLSQKAKNQIDGKLKIVAVFEAISSIFRHISFFLLIIVALLSKRADIFIVSEISCFIPFIQYMCPDARIILIIKEIKKSFTKLSEKGIKKANLIYVTTQPNLIRFKRIFGSTKAKVVSPMISLDTSEERTPCPFPMYICIGTYVKEKNHKLAIQSLYRAFKNNTLPRNTKLVIAGKYDKNSDECKKYFAELTNEAEKLGVSKNIEFRKSISQYEKSALFNIATASLYLEKRDNFTTQPIESQSYGCPVIAVDSPAVNTICKCPGCYLTTDNPNDIAVAMVRCLKQKPRDKELRKNALKFGFEMFSKQIAADIM